MSKRSSPAERRPSRNDRGRSQSRPAYAAGIPAVTIGVTLGSGEHTPHEWIETEPVGAGLTALADTIVGYDRKAG